MPNKVPLAYQHFTGLASAATPFVHSFNCLGGTALYALLQRRDVNTITAGPTYGGQAMTLAHTNDNASHRAEFYRLLSPPTGANDFSITYDAQTNGNFLQLISFEDVNATTPDEGGVIGTETTGTSRSLATAIGANQACIDMLFTGGTIHAEFVPGAGQTKLGNGTSGEVNAGTSIKYSGSDMSWTWDTSMWSNQNLLLINFAATSPTHPFTSVTIS